MFEIWKHLYTIHLPWHLFIYLKVLNTTLWGSFLSHADNAEQSNGKYHAVHASLLVQLVRPHALENPEKVDTAAMNRK